MMSFSSSSRVLTVVAFVLVVILVPCAFNQKLFITNIYKQIQSFLSKKFVYKNKTKHKKRREVRSIIK